MLDPDMTRQLIYRITTTEQQKHAGAQPPARLRLRDPRRSPASVSTPTTSASHRGRVPHDPDGHQVARGARPAVEPPRVHRASRAVSCSSPGRPARASRRRSPRSSTRSTGSAPITSSRSRIRSSSCTTTSAASSTSARSGTTPRRSPTRCAAALRQDPDVILLGEMRDLETISTALTAAETGHLVFATLHTQSAPSTIDRIIDVFPAAQQDQVRMQLANSLQGIVTQTLLPEGRRLGPRLRPRDPVPRRRDPQPDPPGQDRAGLLVHADRHPPRDADDGAVADGARPAAPHHRPRRDQPLEPTRGARLGARAGRYSDFRPCPPTAHPASPALGTALRVAGS